MCVPFFKLISTLSRHAADVYMSDTFYLIMMLKQLRVDTRNQRNSELKSSDCIGQSHGGLLYQFNGQPRGRDCLKGVLNTKSPSASNMSIKPNKLHLKFLTFSRNWMIWYVGSLHGSFLTT